MKHIDILLLNVHSACNAGDHALTIETIQQLKDVFPGCCFTLVVDDPDSYSGKEKAVGSVFTWLHRIGPDRKPHWNFVKLLLLIPMTLIPAIIYRLIKYKTVAFTSAKLHPLIAAYLEADLVVSVPGGFLYSSGNGLTLLLQAFSLALAILAGKPVYIFPQSIGPFRRKWECFLIRVLLRRVRVVMLREMISLDQLKNCKVSHPRIYVLPDIAFAFEGLSRIQGEKWLINKSVDLEQDKPLLGMTTINWGAQNTSFGQQTVYENALRDAARWFIEKYHGKVIFIPQVTGPYVSQDDRIPAKRIIDQLLDVGSSILLIEEPISPELLKALYGCMDIIIGTRMHSNIFAISEGVPILAIGYQYKTRGIAQIAGLEDWVLEIGNINSQMLIERLGVLMEQRFEIRSQINRRLPDIIKQASQAGFIVKDDFITWKNRKGEYEP